MEDAKILLEHLESIHTTAMGVDRIRKNLNLGDVDVVAFCKRQIADPRCQMTRQGKNWYCELDGNLYTVNAHSYTIITAHPKNSILAGKNRPSSPRVGRPPLLCGAWFPRPIRLRKIGAKCARAQQNPPGKRYFTVVYFVQYARFRILTARIWANTARHRRVESNAL